VRSLSKAWRIFVFVLAEPTVRGSEEDFLLCFQLIPRGAQNFSDLPRMGVSGHERTIAFLSSHHLPFGMRLISPMAKYGGVLSPIWPLLPVVYSPLVSVSLSKPSRQDTSPRGQLRVARWIALRTLKFFLLSLLPKFLPSPPFVPAMFQPSCFLVFF